jgi:hypothetical protein
MLEKGGAGLHAPTSVGLHCSPHTRREGKGGRGEATTHGSAWQGEEPWRHRTSPCHIPQCQTLREDATRADPMGERTDPTMEALDPVLEALGQPRKERRQAQTDDRLWRERVKERRSKGERPYRRTIEPRRARPWGPAAPPCRGVGARPCGSGTPPRHPTPLRQGLASRHNQGARSPQRHPPRGGALIPRRSATAERGGRGRSRPAPPCLGEGAVAPRRPRTVAPGGGELVPCRIAAAERGGRGRGGC